VTLATWQVSYKSHIVTDFTSCRCSIVRVNLFNIQLLCSVSHIVDQWLWQWLFALGSWPIRTPGDIRCGASVAALVLLDSVALLLLVQY